MSSSRNRSITINSIVVALASRPADLSRCERRRLTFDPRQIGIEARPGRRGFAPDYRGGRRQIGIVKRAGAHEDGLRPLLGLAEHRSTALRAKAPVHDRAAVGPDHMVGQRSGHRDALLAEKRAHRAGSGAEILADAAPAISRAER